MLSLFDCLLPLVLAVSPPALAQDGGAPPESPKEPEPEVLIKKGVRHGGWGGPVMHVSSLRDRAAVFVGGRGGWLIDGRFTIGGGGFGLTNRIPAPGGVGRPGESLDLQMGYGGGWLEYTFRPLKLVHLSAGLLIGGGEFSLRFRHGGAYGSGNDGFFILEPALMAELNLAKVVRADVGVAYRWIAGADMGDLSYSDVSGPSAVVAFKFGKF
jgi:hypothetical protein